MPGVLIGEITGIIALIAMLADGAPRNRHRAAFLTAAIAHGLLVFTGLELLLWDLHDTDKPLSWFLLGANTFNFCVVGVMIALAAPRRLSQMIRTAVAPLVYAAVWSVVYLLAPPSGAAPSFAEILGASAVYLGLHYAVTSGSLIALLLLDPPPHAPAAKLPPGRRFLSPMGVFWWVLQAAWWTQFVIAVQQRGDAVFGGSWAAGAVSIVFFLWAAIQVVRKTHDRLGTSTVS